MNKDLIENITLLTEENSISGNFEKISAIKQFLEQKENKELLEQNNLVALYGTWGSGKSSIMKTLEIQLDKEQFETLWFDTWKYEKDDNLAYSLFQFILKKTENTDFIENAKLIAKDVFSMFRCLIKPFSFSLGPINIDPSAVIEEAKKIESEQPSPCLWETVEQFEKEFKKLKFKEKKLILFLDDLDRCESENIINLISTIKLLLAINPNIIFMFGIDKEAVSLALQNKYHNDYNKAEEYLEKIFPIQFHLTEMLDSRKLDQYIASLVPVELEEIKKISEFFEYIKFTNPRQIKKVLRKYNMMKNYLQRIGVIQERYYQVIIVLHIIILYLNYQEEYKALLENQKDVYYENTQLQESGRPARKLLQTEVECIFNSVNIRRLLIHLSSIHIEEKIIPFYTTIVNYENWRSIFPDNLCKYFIDYIVNDKNFLNYLHPNGEYNSMYIYDFIRQINNII